MENTMRLMVWPIVLAITTICTHAAEANPLLGCWKGTNQQEGQFLLFEPTRQVHGMKLLSESPRPGDNIQDLQSISQVVVPAKYAPGKVIVTVNGKQNEIAAVVKDGTLTLSFRGNDSTYKKIDYLPPEVDIVPMTLGEAKEVLPEKLKEIREELKKRVVEDQNVRKNKALHSAMQKVDKANTEWLIKQVSELGWIDAKRFGTETSSHAFLLVQHSGNLKLMQAVLPHIETDMKAKTLDSQAYAMLYDRTKLHLGEKQRYGTQVGQDATGSPVLEPLEDKTKVDDFRKEIGLPSLSEYLAIMKRQLGKEVKFAE
jgi:hypothetical protein